MQDRYGNRLGTSSETARSAYIEGVDHVLAATFGGVQAFERAVTADPDFALAHVGLARAQMYAGQMPDAKAALERAVALRDGEDARGQSHIDAFVALFSGRPAEARQRVERHAIDYPRDALCVQMCTNVFGLIGFSGEVGREADLLAFTARLLPHYGDDWWMLSMHALSLCETGHLKASADMMERSLELNPANANGSHFKAHAQYEQGEPEAGLAYLTDWIAGYDKRGVLHGHLSWHKALWALELGKIDLMWDTLETDIAPGASHSLPINVLTDAAALLYRAELAGVPVPASKWRDMSAYASQYFPESGQSFADMHVALCHAMAGQGDELAGFVDGAKGFAADMVAPLAQTWLAMARGEWQPALDALVPVMAQHERIGGSRAQRDLLELTYVQLLNRLGRSDEAQRALVTRRPVLARAA